jgi:hypothetical protein
MSQPLNKKELKRQIKAFLSDKHKGISHNHFADLCGISESLLKQVFVYETLPLSEVVQARVNKGYEQWKAGNVRIMQRPDRTRYVDYRKEPKPNIVPSMGLRVTTEGIKLKIGPRNRHDYGYTSIDEQLGGKK